MKNIGFLGCGKIGKAMLDDLVQEKSMESHLYVTHILNLKTAICKLRTV